MSKLTLASVLEFDKVNKDVSNVAHLLIKVEADKLPDDKKIPAHIVLVIDVSGSMATSVTETYSAKSKLDVVKDVTYKIIDHLRTGDLLTVVTYSDDSQIVLDKAEIVDKEVLKAKIREIVTRGSTNMSGGMSLAYGLCKEDFKGSTRIIVLTDGQANAGVCDINGLDKLTRAKPRYSVVSTFGFGYGVNQELLTLMANSGGGNYFYINDVDQVTGAFAEEFGGAISCVAQNIEIEIVPNKDVEILEVINNFTVDQKGTSAVIKAEDIYSGETKNILVKLKLPAVPDAKDRNSRVCTINGTWFSIAEQKICNDSINQKVLYVPEAEADKDSNRDVARIVATMKLASNFKKASDYADNRQFDEAAKLLKIDLEEWKKLKLLGVPEADRIIASIEDSMNRFNPDNYSAQFGSVMRSASNSAMRSRSIGAGPASALYAKSSVVAAAVGTFNGDAATVVQPAIPDVSSTAVPNTKKEVPSKPISKIKVR